MKALIYLGLAIVGFASFSQSVGADPIRSDPRRAAAAEFAAFRLARL